MYAPNSSITAIMRSVYASVATPEATRAAPASPTASRQSAAGAENLTASLLSSGRGMLRF
jgi:hypothetical protein